MLQIYNSLSRKKEVFTPIEPGKVRMYVCGMTVYDLCHLGHARVLVVFDTVVRYMRYTGLDVTYVRNITDVDDKIINRANENGEDISALTERYIQAMHEDMAQLGVLPPSQEPRATTSMAEIIDMVRELVDRGHAYQGENGDVYYDVSTFEDYGQLSGKQLDDLRAGERVAVDESKDDPLDFVLWKAAKPGEPSWPSPWGMDGRAGISSVPRCRPAAWAIISTSTAAARTCSSPITKMKLRSPRRPPANVSSTYGCTTGSCASTTKKCRNLSVTSSRCAKF